MSVKRQDIPFYVLPFKRKSSAEIIREAKNEIRMKAAQRPSTPNIRDGLTYHGQGASRPPSSASQFSFSPEPQQSRPPSGIRLRPLRAASAAYTERVSSMHLEPTVLKPSLIARQGKSKISSCTSASSSDALQDITESESSSSIQTDDQCKGEHTRQIDPGKSVCLDDVKKKQKTGNERQSYSRKLEKSCLASSVIGLKFDSEAESGVRRKKLEDFQQEVSKFLLQLEKLWHSGKRRNEEHGLELIAKLYKLFEDSKMFQESFEGRVNLLRLLFKLLDPHFPILCFHIAKFVLEMKIGDKNTVNICRLLYQLCHDENNVVEFLSCNILGPFIRCLRGISSVNNPEALKFAISLVCILAANDVLLNILSVYKSDEVLLQHLSKICELEIEARSVVEMPHIVTKLLTALRYLMEEEALCKGILSSGLSIKLLRVLEMYHGNMEVVITTVRLMSKMAESNEGCQAMLACNNACGVLVKLLITYKLHLFVVSQITFIVGNIIAHDDNTAPVFHSTPGFIDLLMSYLADFLENQREKSKSRPSFSGLISAGDHSVGEEEAELLLKVARIFANMCLNPMVGKCLAEDEGCVTSMLKLIDAYKLQDSSSEVSESLTGILTVMNNITYFMDTDMDVTSLCVKVAEAIIPLLSTENAMEVRIEACNVVSNITRVSDVRSYMLRHKLVPAFVSLITEYNHSIAIGGYAILMNLLLDERAKEPFYKEQGITKLLQKFHLCLSRDWKTAALLCQTLWNYCSCDKSYGKPLTVLEIQHLIKVLTYSTGPDVMLDTDDNESKKVWESEFCVVASKLLERLQEFS